MSKPEESVVKKYLGIDNNILFEIPEYQRAYTWGKDHCDKLFEDIKDYMENNSNNKRLYFFGTIIFERHQEGDKEVKRLIDGQQRTTTFLLLTKALLMQIEKHLEKLETPKDKNEEKTKINLTNRKQELMKILYNIRADYEADDIEELENDWANKVKNIEILKNFSINETDDNREHLVKILNSRTFEDAEKKVLENKDLKIRNKKGDNKYSNYFKNLRFFYTKLEAECVQDNRINIFANNFLTRCQVIEIPCEDQYEAISMFNSLNSKGMPLRDSDIISAKIYSKSDNIDEIKKKWKELKEKTDFLEKEGVVDIEALLSEYMHYYRVSTLEEKDAEEVHIPSVRDFFLTEIDKKGFNPIELCDSLLTFARLWEILKDFVVVKVLLKFNQNFKYFFITYFYARFNLKEEIKEEEEIKSFKEEIREEVEKYAELLLRLFVILEVSPNATYGISNFKSFLFKQHKDIVNKEKSFEEIKKSFDEHILRLMDIYKIAEDNNIPEYKKHSIVFLNEYLYCKEKGKVREFDFNLNTNVEHILPLSGQNMSKIRQDANLTDEDDFKSYVNQIGNKILLEEKINKQIKNEWFRSKQGEEGEKGYGYKNSKRVGLVQEIAKYDNGNGTWTKDDIDKNTKEYTERILKFIKGE